MSLGVLYQAGMPLPMLLDAVAHAETGHLNGPERYTATSRKGARGMYQFMPGNLHDMGYRMPQNIPLSDVLDPTKARDLAGQYITGYSDYHQFKTPLQQLVAYNAGPTFAAQWIANGEDVSQLPAETQDYIRKAAKYIDDQNNTSTTTNNSNQGTQAMASGDGYDDARRAFFTEDEIAQAKRRGIEARGMIARREVAHALDPNKRRQDGLPSDNPRSSTPQPAPALQQPNMMTRGGVDINNPPGGGVTNDPNFGAFLQGRQGGTEITPSASIFDYSNISPALQNNPQFADYMQGMIQANPDVPPAALANTITEAERMMGINNPLGGGGKSASLISSAMASNATTPANTPPITTTVPSAAAPSSGAQPPVNRRDQSPMSMAAPRIGNINDLLIRMGSAGARGAATSGLESFAAMGDAYTDYYKDQNDMVAKYNESLSKANKGKASKGGSAMSGVVVNDALNRVDPLLSGWSTGFGSYLNMIPGSDAQKVKNLLATVKGNIGFDKLQAMRDASPTGGALGQVSERELTFLQSVFGSLEQDQSPEELRYNLQLLRYVYNNIIHGAGNHGYTMPGGAASAAPAAASNNVSAARAIVAGNP